MSIEKLIQECNIRYHAKGLHPENLYLKFRYKVALKELTNYHPHPPISYGTLKNE